VPESLALSIPLPQARLGSTTDIKAPVPAWLRSRGVLFMWRCLRYLRRPLALVCDGRGGLVVMGRGVVWTGSLSTGSGSTGSLSTAGRGPKGGGEAESRVVPIAFLEPSCTSATIVERQGRFVGTVGMVRLLRPAYAPLGAKIESPCESSQGFFVARRFVKHPTFLALFPLSYPHSVAKITHLRRWDSCRLLKRKGRGCGE